MKKLITLLLVFVMLLSLCACGGQNNETSAPSTEAPTVNNSEIGDPATADTTEPADPKVLAESCIDKPLTDLIALIGEPISSDYAPSCMNPGVGEDGNLEYDGFMVYTYREGDEEIVKYVE